MFDARQVHLVEANEEWLVALGIRAQQDCNQKARSIIAAQVEIPEQVRTIIPIRSDGDHLELSITGGRTDRFRKQAREARFPGSRISG